MAADVKQWSARLGLALLRGLAGHLNRWVARVEHRTDAIAERISAPAPVPSAERESAPNLPAGGPPAHWVAKVQQAAPQLLRPAFGAGPGLMPVNAAERAPVSGRGHPLVSACSSSTLAPGADSSASSTRPVQSTVPIVASHPAVEMVGRANGPVVVARDSRNREASTGTKTPARENSAPIRYPERRTAAILRPAQTTVPGKVRSVATASASVDTANVNRPVTPKKDVRVPERDLNRGTTSAVQQVEVIREDRAANFPIRRSTTAEAESIERSPSLQGESRLTPRSAIQQEQDNDPRTRRMDMSKISTAVVERMNPIVSREAARPETREFRDRPMSFGERMGKETAMNRTNAKSAPSARHGELMSARADSLLRWTESRASTKDLASKVHKEQSARPAIERSGGGDSDIRRSVTAELGTWPDLLKPSESHEAVIDEWQARQRARERQAHRAAEQGRNQWIA